MFLAAYALYVFKEVNAEVGVQAELEPLRFGPKKNEPETGWVHFQTILSLVIIFLGSHIFVSNLEHISLAMNIPGHIGIG